MFHHVTRLLSALLVCSAITGCVAGTADPGAEQIDERSEALGGATDFVDACSGTVASPIGTFRCSTSGCSFTYTSEPFTGIITDCEASRCKRSAVGSVAWQSTGMGDGRRATWTIAKSPESGSGEVVRSEMALCSTDATGRETCDALTEIAICTAAGCTHEAFRLNGVTPTGADLQSWFVRFDADAAARTAMSTQVEAPSGAGCGGPGVEANETHECLHLDLASDMACGQAEGSTYDEEACNTALNEYFCECGSGEPLPGHTCD